MHGSLNFLDTYIKEDKSFAAYKLPGDSMLHFVVQESGSPVLLHSIEALNGRKGFVIAPFAASTAFPIVLIQPTEKIERPFLPIKVLKGQKERKGRKEEEAYVERFQTFITPIRDRQFKKLVLSRSTTIEREAGFSPAEAFALACTKYIRSYVYLCHTPQTGTWLGSTPEMLLSGEGNVWHTVAIAGTQPLQNGELPKTWDDKNLIEQMLVSYYIRTQLTSSGIHPSEKGPYTVRAGELAHLRSDFMFSLPDTGRLGSLLELLHPTPAVSGLPKEEAYRFICENEGYSRRYYSGFIGWLEPDGKSDLYVNLRCMNIHDNSFTLYAGGGLLPSSVPEQEWQETEDKLQTMLYLTEVNNYVRK
ncbi:MAG: isochorismate synthase [Tannerellaceae bacterium]|jgi:isochorismate synthase|nr:isochorismate synthase [Tannerellaceae bacterium]